MIRFLKENGEVILISTSYMTLVYRAPDGRTIVELNDGSNIYIQGSVDEAYSRIRGIQ